jgi:hypothetical protein
LGDCGCGYCAGSETDTADLQEITTFHALPLLFVPIPTKGQRSCLSFLFLPMADVCLVIETRAFKRAVRMTNRPSIIKRPALTAGAKKPASCPTKG